MLVARPISPRSKRASSGRERPSSRSSNTAVWPFMQYGTFFTIPALAPRAPCSVGSAWLSPSRSPGSAYLVALVVKAVVDRGRPAALLRRERELFGADSPVSPRDAAVAAAITVVWPLTCRGDG